ncbi:unnamed protein product [Gongylonema pulchrum]|uniref:Neurotransmitter-gated ion-channel ligand-binding domain-containing protein n=1 Tax=Gongylonema pulchrum TaxID=637853 RepID=A0A3P6QHZ4_9BILA|nr:unnamed protein product [Gongylonema pulchrum]
MTTNYAGTITDVQAHLCLQELIQDVPRNICPLIFTAFKKWNDYRLVWNRSEYKEIESVRFRSDMLWRPDILLYNSGAENFDSTYKSQMLVYSNGDVTWIPPGIFRTSCKIDVTWFPFDDLSFWLLDIQWLSAGSQSTSVKREETYYKCCSEPYYSVKFFLNVRRRTFYYGFNVIIPSLLIAMLTTLAFTLPPLDLSEKIGFREFSLHAALQKTNELN